MGLLDSMLGSIGYQRTGRIPARTFKAPRSREVPDFITNSDALVEHQTDVARFWKYAERYTQSPMDYAAVGRVIDAIAQAGQNKLRVFPDSRPWDETSPLPDHLLYELLRNPAPHLTQFELFEDIAGWNEIAGNSYLYIHQIEESLPASLWPLSPPHMCPQIDRTDGLTGYTYTVNGKPFTLPAEQVMHVKRWNPFDPYLGLSPSEAVAYSTASDLAMLQYNWGWFLNGARPSVVIESDENTANPDDVDAMKQEFMRDFTGDPKKMQKVVALWGGFKIREHSKGPKDVDFAQGRRTNLTDILAARGVHPSLVTSEDVNRANAETGEYFFAKYAIAPRLARIASQFNKNLMVMYGDGALVRFVDVVPDDLKTKAVVGKANAETLKILVAVMGVEEGLKEAKRQGVVSQEAKLDVPKPQSEMNNTNANTDNGTNNTNADNLSADELDTLKEVAEQYIKAAEMFGEIRRAA